MAWTYDPTLSTAKDQVRFLIRDTVSTDPLLQDEEINYLLMHYGSVGMAASVASGALAAQFARMPTSKTIDGLSITWGDRAEAYATLHEELSATVGALGQVPTAGGLSRAEKALALSDPDRPKMIFDIGMHDYPPSAYPPALTHEEM